MTADEILSRTIFTKEGFTNYELEIVIEAMKDYAADFATWYSGMERSKVIRAIERYELESHHKS